MLMHSAKGQTGPSYPVISLFVWAHIRKTAHVIDQYELRVLCVLNYLDQIVSLNNMQTRLNVLSLILLTGLEESQSGKVPRRLEPAIWAQAKGESCFCSFEFSCLIRSCATKLG